MHLLTFSLRMLLTIQGPFCEVYLCMSYYCCCQQELLLLQDMSDSEMKCLCFVCVKESQVLNS